MEWDSFTFIYCFNCQGGEVRTDSGGAGMRDFLHGQHSWRVGGFLPWFSEIFISWWSYKLTWWPGNRSTVLSPGCTGGAGDTQVVTLGSSPSVLGRLINLSACTEHAHRPVLSVGSGKGGFGFFGGCCVCLLSLIPPLIHLGSPIVQWEMRNCAKKFSWPNTRIVINVTKNNSDLSSCPLG